MARSVDFKRKPFIIWQNYLKILLLQQRLYLQQNFIWYSLSCPHCTSTKIMCIIYAWHFSSKRSSEASKQNSYWMLLFLVRNNQLSANNAVILCHALTVNTTLRELGQYHECQHWKKWVSSSGLAFGHWARKCLDTDQQVCAKEEKLQ